MKAQFGIELEVVGIEKTRALKALRAVGIQVEGELRNHEAKPHWKIVPDGSVADGFEVVSPILKGDGGMAQAQIAARALEDAGAYANKSCGYHVHFDAGELGVNVLKQIIRRYAKHEAEIDAFMPPSRRGNENQYCKSLTTLICDSFEQATTPQQLAQAQPSRYYKVNLQSYQRHGTIEFRHHSGTVNAAKITNWICFLYEFIEECKKLNDLEAGAQMASQETWTEMQKKLAGMFESNGLASLDDICQHFGWLAHTGRSAIARLRQKGLDIVSEKINGQTGYRLRGQTAGETLWAGISRDVALFYQRRAAVLACGQ